MKLRNAYLCHNCREVFAGAPYGHCPTCRSGSIYPLGWLALAEEDRTQWLARIYGHGRGATLHHRRPTAVVRQAPADRRLLSARRTRPKTVGHLTLIKNGGVVEQPSHSEHGEKRRSPVGRQGTTLVAIGKETAWEELAVENSGSAFHALPLLLILLCAHLLIPFFLPTAHAHGG
ncbi:MAG TPA: hypothetical protein VNN62_00470 [Methylomirabilota bacterium]|nr:hypothetical protein [Methylomirabilota bacterium]